MGQKSIDAVLKQANRKGWQMWAAYIELGHLLSVVLAGYHAVREDTCNGMTR